MLSKSNSRLKLRYESTNPNINGLLMEEDLWDLTPSDLNNMAKKLNRRLKEAEEEDFLDEVTTGSDKKIRAEFDTVIHVLETKKDEAKKSKEDLDRKKKKEKLMEILDKKEDASLENMSKTALRKMISEI